MGWNSADHTAKTNTGVPFQESHWENTSINMCVVPSILLFASNIWLTLVLSYDDTADKNDNYQHQPSRFQQNRVIQRRVGEFQGARATEEKKLAASLYLDSVLHVLEQGNYQWKKRCQLLKNKVESAAPYFTTAAGSVAGTSSAPEENTHIPGLGIRAGKC